MKTLLKRSALFVVFLILIALLVAAFNYTYVNRVFTYMNGEERITEVDWYKPTAKVERSESPLTLKRSEDKLAKQETTFSESLNYAESIDSSAFLVWQEGEVIAEKYWNGYDADSYSQTNSTHKTILALVVGIAVSEGSIESVNDPVSKYLGDWIEQTQGEITIEHLLTMSSGLGKAPSKIFLLDHRMLEMSGTDIDRVAKTLPQSGPPGERFNYIGTNTQLLIAVLESATGQQYESYIEDKLWSRLAESPAELWMDREDGTPHGACCIITKADDLLRIGLLILNGGKVNGQQLVPEQWIRSMTTPSKTNPNYGYLVWFGSPFVEQRKYNDQSDFFALHSEPYLANDLIYLDGFGGQRVYLVPSRNLAIVRVGKLTFDFDDATIPNLVMRALSP